MLLDQLEKGRARIVCDPEAGWCEVVRIEDLEKNNAIHNSSGMTQIL